MYSVVCGYALWYFEMIKRLDSTLCSANNIIAQTGKNLDLANKLGLEVIAEGVETAEQFEFMRTHDCDLVQGYYLSRPLPRFELMELLQRK